MRYGCILFFNVCYLIFEVNKKKKKLKNFKERIKLNIKKLIYVCVTKKAG